MVWSPDEKLTRGYMFRVSGFWLIFVVNPAERNRQLCRNLNCESEAVLDRVV